MKNINQKKNYIHLNNTKNRIIVNEKVQNYEETKQIILNTLSLKTPPEWGGLSFEYPIGKEPGILNKFFKFIILFKYIIYNGYNITNINNSITINIS